MANAFFDCLYVFVGCVVVEPCYTVGWGDAHSDAQFVEQLDLGLYIGYCAFEVFVVDEFVQDVQRFIILEKAIGVDEEG